MREFYGEGGWMQIVALLWDAPYIALSVGLWCKLEFPLSYQIKDFISWKEIARIEVDSSAALPDDNLPDWKSLKNICPVL